MVTWVLNIPFIDSVSKAFMSVGGEPFTSSQCLKDLLDFSEAGNVTNGFGLIDQSECVDRKYC